MKEGVKNHHKGEYPENWKEIAGKVKERAGWKCQLCGHKHEPSTGYTLTVAHLDNNKSNCSKNNLAALCQRCHLRLQPRIIFLLLNQQNLFGSSKIEAFYLKILKRP